jgi:hypothetical protein
MAHCCRFSNHTAHLQVQKYVADVLRQHYTRYSDYMSREADMRRELQRYVTTLEVSPVAPSATEYDDGGVSYMTSCGATSTFGGVSRCAKCALLRADSFANAVRTSAHTLATSSMGCCQRCGSCRRCAVVISTYAVCPQRCPSEIPCTENFWRRLPGGHTAALFPSSLMTRAQQRQQEGVQSSEHS